MSSLAIRQSKLQTSSALILLGLALLGYVSVQYGMMFFQQRKLAREWAAQQGPRTSAAVPATHDGLTRLLIPKIGFSAIVVEGAGHRELLLGPGHIPNTATPGESGNAVITAHRDTFFRHIVALGKGDQILVQRGGDTYTYEVAYSKVVEPTDVSVTTGTSDTRLTLITCYPIYYIGPAPERLVVVAKLAAPPLDRKTPPGTEVTVLAGAHAAEYGSKLARAHNAR